MIHTMTNALCTSRYTLVALGAVATVGISLYLLQSPYLGGQGAAVVTALNCTPSGRNSLCAPVVTGVVGDMLNFSIRASSIAPRETFYFEFSYNKDLMDVTTVTHTPIPGVTIKVNNDRAGGRFYYLAYSANSFTVPATVVTIQSRLKQTGSESFAWNDVFVDGNRAAPIIVTGSQTGSLTVQQAPAPIVSSVDVKLYLDNQTSVDGVDNLTVSGGQYVKADFTGTGVSLCTIATDNTQLLTPRTIVIPLRSLRSLAPVSAGATISLTCRKPDGTSIVDRAVITLAPVTPTDTTDTTDTATPPTTSDTTDPVVTLTAPSVGALLTSSPVILTAQASDNGVVTRVEFYDGTTLLGTDTTVPYSLSWAITSSKNGSHDLRAKAYDAVGRTGDSAIVTISVTIPTVTTTPTTPTPTPPTGSTTVGPTITYFGLAQADGKAKPSSGTYSDGSKVYSNAFGGGYYLIVEAVAGTSGKAPGTLLKPTSGAPDLQIIADTQLGTSPTFGCGTYDSVAAQSDFTNNTMLKNFACKFVVGKATMNANGSTACIGSSPSCTQYYFYVTGGGAKFPEKAPQYVNLQARVRDSAGNVGDTKTMKLCLGSPIGSCPLQ